MKAIIEVAKGGSAIRAARQQIKDSEIGKPVNFRLFSELTPARLDLLDTLSKIEPCSIYALAKTAERNYSNVHTDVNRLEELGLIERTEEDKIFIPFESIEIFMPLAKAA
jgi:predicted transcriptional regulator